MVKINLKTKLGYRKQNINPDKLIYYRKTKYGYSKKNPELISKIHERVIEKRLIERYKVKIEKIKVHRKEYLKEYHIKRQKKRLDIIEKNEELEELEEPEELEELEERESEVTKTSHNWLCECEVSDRKFEHLFGVSGVSGTIEEYVIEEHNNYFIDHKLISIEKEPELTKEYIRKLDKELQKRKEYITKTTGVFFYD